MQSASKTGEPLLRICQVKRAIFVIGCNRVSIPVLRQAVDTYDGCSGLAAKLGLCGEIAEVRRNHDQARTQIGAQLIEVDQFFGVIVVCIAQHEPIAVGEGEIFCSAHHCGKKGAKVPFTGWRISGIGTSESGNALTVVNTLTSAADFTGFDEMFVSGGPNIGHSQKSFSHLFHAAAFSLPPNGVRSNSGLGTVRGPGQNNIDLSLAKNLALHENWHVEFRADSLQRL